MGLWLIFKADAIFSIVSKEIFCWPLSILLIFVLCVPMRLASSCWDSPASIRASARDEMIFCREARISNESLMRNTSNENMLSWMITAVKEGEEVLTEIHVREDDALGQDFTGHRWNR